MVKYLLKPITSEQIVERSFDELEQSSGRYSGLRKLVALNYSVFQDRTLADFTGYGGGGSGEYGDLKDISGNLQQYISRWSDGTNSKKVETTYESKALSRYNLN